MKTKAFFFRIFPLLFLACSFIMVSCEDDDDEVPSNEVAFKEATLNGAQEVPVNASQATGTFKGTFNKDTKILSYTITFSGITPTAMHFHKEAVGKSGPVVIPINGPYTSPLVGQTPALTADQETDLMAGMWYVNVHSSQFPGGEIRTQVVKQ
ncbi:hypothetical protein TH63_10865 [Rufibacter radiotolerans]|uniref:CHRD domain-containing protein n=1 Tax=Rufibacter radiotolerans TaxID=1379910 RepID=A0A0H4W6G9_9BACT|nr:CHRD domain-containing protein [Rufibacter radiotolerans]AKQ46026.1 hypothetical protein TH63_10865 [Rufibacter radiotolerans]